MTEEEQDRAGYEGHTPGPWTVEWDYPQHRATSPACQQSCGKGRIPRRVFDSQAMRGNWPAEMHEMSEPRWFNRLLAADGTVLFEVGQDYDDRGSGPDNPADARLIAAAPDLLQRQKELEEGLERFVKWYDSGSLFLPQSEIEHARNLLSTHSKGDSK